MTWASCSRVFERRWMVADGGERELPEHTLLRFPVASFVFVLLLCCGFLRRENLRENVDGFVVIASTGSLHAKPWLHGAEMCGCRVRRREARETGRGLANLSLPDCGTNEPDLKKEMEKQFVDLLTEELNLREAVAKAQNHHMNNTIAEARRLASQYRREAEKCNVATEACEEARELAQSSLIREKRLTLLWERRARHLGWHGE